MNRIFLKIRRLFLLLLVLCLCFVLLAWLFGGSSIGGGAGSRGRRTEKASPAVGASVTPANATLSASWAPSTSGHAGGFPLLDDPSLSEVKFDRTQPVVRIIHQSWVNRTLPPLFSRWSKTFPTCFPDYHYAMWSDADNRRLIARHYAWFLPRFDSYGAGVQKADVSRLFYMYHFGGVYCDLDCECLANFEHMLVNTSLAFGAMKGKMIFSETDPSYVEEGQIENSFMYSRPRHPFFWSLIQELNATTVGLSIMTSGPYLIMKGIRTARKHGMDKTQIDGRPYLTIYPPRLFNPFSWIEYNAPQCRLYGEFDENSLKSCRDSFKESYVLQYHTQVWDKGMKNVLERIKV